MQARLFSTRSVAVKTRTTRKLALLLAGAVALAACSSIPDVKDMKSWVGMGDGKPAPQSEPVALTQAKPGSAVPVAADADFATSETIHPDIWPLNPPRPRDPAVEAEVARLLSQMTLEEKIGQMMQPDIKAVTLDDVTRYHLGSILNGGSAGPHGDLRAPAQDWLAAADAYYDASMAVGAGRPAIPVIWGIDAVHGHGHIIGATLFPHNIGLGAMRDPNLVRRIGEITAQEIRVTGQEWTFAPTIAVVRDDRWGRTYEGFSEDPQIVASNAAAMVEGLQGQPGTPDFLKNGHVLASIKHFLGDGGTDHGVNEGNTIYSEPAVRDLFGPPYQAAIKAGAENVMVSYSGWRGTKMHIQKGLVTDVLEGRMGFDGFVVSDYQAIDRVPGCNVADCPRAANAGIDMFMTADNWKGLYGNLVNEASAGMIPMSRIDDAVSRILRVKLMSGLMTAGRPSARPYAGHYELLGSVEHRAVARQAVRESLVLLKNDGGLLPLSPRSHVLVAGDAANNMTKQTGGWTITWQGTNTSRADFPHATTIYEGIKAEVEASGGTATLSEDGNFQERPDVAIVVFGEDAYAEGKGDISTLEYQPGDKRDLRLLQRLQAQGIPVVAVFLSGRPLYVTPEINASNAFLAAWLPGSEGEGVSDVLFSNGDGSVAYDFRGKLSFSWPRAPDQFALNAGVEPYYPLFSLGYGLTYGAPVNIGRLPEGIARSGSAAAPMVPRVLFENGETAVGWSVAAGGQRFTSSTTAQGLRVSRSAAGLQASWSSRVPVSLTITGIPANLTRDAEHNLSLSLALRVDKAPASTVVLGMGCGPLCGGKLDVTQALRNAESRGWTTLSVPLSCLSSAGADLANVTTPFALTSSGSFAVSLASVKITRAGDALACAAVPPVTAAAAVPLGSARDLSSRGSKRKAGAVHERKKRSVNTGGKRTHRRHH
jgi:beta-glucosidase